MTTNNTLPVVIAGAGPCGLITALVLQSHAIPYIVVERCSSQSKLCSNVGAGYDLAPAALEILKNRLHIDYSGLFREYAGMYLCNMDCKPIREARTTDVGERFEAFSANRADMQRLFLDKLLKQTTENVIRYGLEVEGYKEQEDCVVVQLSDGTTIQALALLGCDGIHSKVRRAMHDSGPENGKEVKDDLNFLNTHAYWGKKVVEKDSTLWQKLQETQSYKEGQSFLWALGNAKAPGSFMCAPVGDTLLWAYFHKAEEPPKSSDDLTRRGGISLDSTTKEQLFQRVEHCGDLIRLIIEETPSSSITLAGLFDRKNLRVPYTKGRVALLGDAAHPQSPYMGQGVNQSIADGYVCATRIAMAIQNNRSIASALQKYDTKKRRKGVNKVIRKARTYGNACVSESRFTGWFFQFMTAHVPLPWIFNDMLEADRPNADFVLELDRDLKG